VIEYFPVEKDDTEAAVSDDLLQRSKAALGWPELLKALEGRAASEPGKRECLDPVMYGTAAACEIALQETEEMAGLFTRGDPPPSAPIADVAPRVEAARADAVLEPEDLVKVSDLLGHAALAAAFFPERDKVGRLAEWAAKLDEIKPLRRALERSIDRDGSILDTASPTLGSLRKKRETLSLRIHKRLSELVARHQDDLLQDSFYTQRGERYVLPVKSSARNKMKGIVHDASGTGQTVFVEPEELIEPNNKLRLIVAEIDEEIRRILFDLSQQVGRAADQIVVNQRTLAHLDAVRARARLAVDLEASRPKIVERGAINIKAARHPLLALRGHEVVPNDLALGDDARVLVISGPNAGGKTVALTMVGLIALMARAGMFVPADPGAEVALFSEVYAVIGDEQDLSRDLSTFAAHLMDVRVLLDEAGPSSLVLLDELMSSTDPDEGSALGAAALARLRDCSALVIATTHFPSLKSFAHEREGFMNASFSFDPKSLSPTYKIMTGIPGRSMGIEMARRLGLPAEVVDEARSRIDESELRMESLLAELADRIAFMDEEGLALDRLKRENEAMFAEYQSLLDQSRKREKETRRETREAIRNAVRQVEDELDKMMGELKVKGAVRRGDVLVVRRRIAGVKDEAEARWSEDEAGGGVDWVRAKAGDRIKVAPLGVEASLVEVPAGEVGEGDKVKVRIGKMIVMVEAGRIFPLPEAKSVSGADLLKPKPKPKPKPKKKKTSRPKKDHGGALAAATSDSPVLPQTKRNTIDLRGLRYNEAEAIFENFLDKAAGEFTPNVFIIHGHGTGALKKMVRELLAISPYVKEFRPGERGEGGDGVTMAELNV